MKKIIITIGIVLVVMIGLVILKNSSATSSIIWSLSNEGTWLLPLVLIAALLDSVHPCSFSILLITIAFFFGIQVSRRKILQLGGTYIAGIFAAYFLIGLGIVKGPMAKLMDRASFPAVFGLGILVGICQFPCMGGPYLMVIGLLRDQMSYVSGFNYLLLYNLILIIPLVVVLFISANKLLVDKVQIWKRDNIGGLKLWTGIAMIIIGILIFFI